MEPHSAQLIATYMRYSEKRNDIKYKGKNSFAILTVRNYAFFN